MPALISLFLFFILASVIVLYGYKAYVRPARFFEQLGPERDFRRHSAAPGGTRVAFRVIEQIGATVPVSKDDSTLARRYLTAAGFRSEKGVAIYYGIKVTMCVAAVGAALLLAPYITARNPIRLLLYAAAGGLGFAAPNLILERMVSARQRRLRIGLPDALDLMVIAVESGLGMDQAFISVTTDLRNTHRDVTDEFSLVNPEMRAGKRRSDALHNLALRTGEPEVRILVAVLAQTDRFGTGIVDALRTHADFMRASRCLAAEEKAGKLGVKLVFVFFSYHAVDGFGRGGPGSASGCEIAAAGVTRRQIGMEAKVEEESKQE
jgi:tight adherence protein C